MIPTVGKVSESVNGGRPKLSGKMVKNKTQESDKDAKICKLKKKLVSSTEEIGKQSEQIKILKKEIEELRKIIVEIKQGQSAEKEKAKRTQKDEVWPEAGPSTKRVRLTLNEENDDNNQEMDTETVETRTYAAKVKQIPPVVVQGAKDWLKLREDLKINNIEFDRAKKIGEDLKIFIKTADEHRKLTSFLNKNNKPFYTYKLDEDKKQHVVLKGLDAETPIECIREEFEQLGCENLEVSQMKSKKGESRVPLPLFLIKTTSEKVWNTTRHGGQNRTTKEADYTISVLSLPEVWAHSDQLLDARKVCQMC